MQIQSQIQSQIQTHMYDQTKLTDRELLARTERLVRTERKLTLEILNMINEVWSRRAFLEAGCSSCYAWLTKGLGYSEGAASRRLRSAEMLRKVPDVGIKIEEGTLNISTLAQAQSAIRAEEKRTGEALTTAVRTDLVSKIESCTQKQTEGKLAARFPEALPRQEFVRPIDGSRAKGGTNAIVNLRALCRAHNVLAAERSFGLGHMEKFRNG